MALGEHIAKRMKRSFTPSSSWLRTTLLLAAVGCAPQSATVGGGETKEDPSNVPDDVANALAQLPDAHVLLSTPDGLPLYIAGEMAKVGAVQMDDIAAANAALRPALSPVLAPFRLVPDDLQLTKINTDADGGRHFRYAMKHDGLDVIGADIVVHVDVKGAIHAINGTARGDIDAQLGAHPIANSTAVDTIIHDARFSGVQGRATTAPRLVYIETLDGEMHKAFEVVVSGNRGEEPVRDKVYVDVDNGQIVADYPQIHFAENRKVYSSNNGSSTPGTLKRSEGQAATSDVDVNAAYDGTGDAYEAYKNFWNRDSYDNAGAPLISSVHYSTNYCNAYWDGSQMVYGDGSASEGCAPLARSVDVTAHELTHAVTERESGLVYSGESGGINESMSDVFGTFVEAWVDGGKTGTLAISSDTWLLGEDVIAGGLRYMCDPAKDGGSKDLWTSSAGSVDVHYSSGIGNLAFCLLSKGGTHPRGKTTVNVPALGMDKAIRIFYKANTDILTSNSNYASLRTATTQAAQQLGYTTAEQDAVGCAFAAVGVGTAPGSCGGSTPPPPTGTDGTLTSGKAVTASGAKDSNAFWKIDVPAGQTTLTITTSGGSGDADMYVKFGAKPSSSAYDCRPYKNGNAETCTFTPPQAGTYWVMLNAYAAFSGLTLTATYNATTPPPTSGDPYLTKGTSVAIAGATSSVQYWRVALPAGANATVKMSGGSGDADLYTRAGSRPTTTTYSCRPYLTGNTETCAATTTAATDLYVMVRGYAAFTGTSLVASW